RFTLAAALSTSRRAGPFPFDKARKAITRARAWSTDALYFRVLGQRQRKALDVDAGVERQRAIPHGAGDVPIGGGQVQPGERAIVATQKRDGRLRPATGDRHLTCDARRRVQPDALSV